MNELRATHDQRYLSENNEAGDCWRTCIASLLGIPRDDVPHFMEQACNSIGLYSWAQMLANEEPTPWLELTQKWLAERNYELREFPSGDDDQWDWAAAPVRYLILTGTSPRGGFGHSVIVDAHALAAENFTGAIAHDPHPSRAGITDAWDCFYITEKGGQ